MPQVIMFKEPQIHIQDAVITAKKSLLDELDVFIKEFILTLDLRSSREPFELVGGWMLNVNREHWSLTKRRQGSFVEITDQSKNLKDVQYFMKSIKSSRGWLAKLQQIVRQCEQDHKKLHGIRLILNSSRAHIYKTDEGDVVLKVIVNRPLELGLIETVRRRLWQVNDDAAAKTKASSGGLRVGTSFQGANASLTIVLRSLPRQKKHLERFSPIQEDGE